MFENIRAVRHDQIAVSSHVTSARGFEPGRGGRRARTATAAGGKYPVVFARVFPSGVDTAHARLSAQTVTEGLAGQRGVIA